jgi:hypothetical protein
LDKFETNKASFIELVKTGLIKEFSMSKLTSSPIVRNITSLLTQWDWGLSGLIFLYMALPRFYRSYSVYLIGNAIPDTGAWQPSLSGSSSNPP